MPILDIEASGHRPESYPIEIAFCDLDGESAYTTLINPDTAGDWESWDDYAEEAVHGLSRSHLLREGRDVITVSRELTHRLRDQDVYSDAPEFDGFWLDRLFESVGRDNPIRLRSLRDLYCGAYQNEIERMLCTIDRPHRALADCQVLAANVRAIIEQQHGGNHMATP